MNRIEDAAKRLISPPRGVVQRVSRLSVVTVVGEPAEVDIKGAWPISIGDVCVEKKKVIAAGRGLFVPEPTLVTARKEAGERIVRRRARSPALINCIDDEVGARDLVKGNGSLQLALCRSISRSPAMTLRIRPRAVRFESAPYGSRRSSGRLL